MAVDLHTDKGRVTWAMNTIYQHTNNMRKEVEIGFDCKTCFALYLYLLKGVVDELWEEYGHYAGVDS